MHLDLALGQESRGHLPEHLCEFEIFGLGGEIHGAEFEVFTNGGVTQCSFIPHLLVKLVDGFGGDGEEGTVDTTGRGHGGYGDLGAFGFGYAVEGVFDVVFGVLFDVLGAGGGVVVEGLVGAQTLDVGEVARGTGGDYLEAGELGELDGQGAGGGRAAVDEDGEFAGAGLGGEGEFEGLVEALSDAVWYVSWSYGVGVLVGFGF